MTPSPLSSSLSLFSLLPLSSSLSLLLSPSCSLPPTLSLLLSPSYSLPLSPFPFLIFLPPVLMPSCSPFIYLLYLVHSKSIRSTEIIHRPPCSVISHAMYPAAWLLSSLSLHPVTSLNHIKTSTCRYYPLSVTSWNLWSHVDLVKCTTSHKLSLYLCTKLSVNSGIRSFHLWSSAFSARVAVMYVIP